MSRFKNIARTKIVEASKASNRPDATVNRAGGVSFEISDAATKLVTMTGARFFAEPSYYSADTCVGTRDSNGKIKGLQERVKLATDKAAKFASVEGLDDVSREIIATVWDVCESENPRDALAIANWLRNEMNIRLTPQIILVLCSRHPATQKYVREYAPKIIVRPDEVKTVLMAHRYFFGAKTIKNCLNMGLGDAISKFSEKALIKYDDSNFPKWKDVLRWVKRKQGWPLSKELARYFTHGEVSPEGTPIAYKRKLLASKSTFDEEAQRLAKESFANWEVLSSQFATTPEGKNAVWSFGVDNGLIGYMAMLRNVRNMLEAGVSGEVIDKVCAKLSDRKQVMRSRQLPFRYIAAHNIVENLYGVDSMHAGRVLEAIETACDISAENVEALPGVTAIFADNSGSMRQPVSGRSNIDCATAANVLCGIIAKRAEKPYVAAFGTDVGPVTFSKRTPVLSIAKKVQKANTKGMSTNAHRCVEWMMSKGITPDRVIILSDMQCWNDTGYVWGYGSKSSYSNLPDAWQAFRKGGGKDAWLHSVHLNGYGDNAIDPSDGKVSLISGFSEKIVNMMLQAEGVVGEDGEVVALPTIDQIRANW